MQLGLTSPLEDRVRWLVEYFLRLDFTKLREGEKLDLYEDAIMFAPVEEAPFFNRVFPKLVSLQREIRTGIDCLWARKPWLLPKAPALQLQYKVRDDDDRDVEPVVIVRYGGRFAATFLAHAAHDLASLWGRLRRCAYRECTNFFVPTRRQRHCSAECSKKENWARYVERHRLRKRDYKAELASRWADKGSASR